MITYQHLLPEMDDFVFSLDENHNTVIHFLSTDKNKLEQMIKKIQLPHTIHKQNDLYFIKVEANSLIRLFGNLYIVSYLWLYTHYSIFWTVRTKHYRDLHQKLLENNVKSLSVHELNPDNKFSSLKEKRFYRQLIRESIGIEEAVIDFSYPDSSVTSWLIDTIQSHDKINHLSLIGNKDFHTLESTENSIWDQTLLCIKSLRKLKKISCSNIPLFRILNLITNLSNDKQTKCPEIVILNDYEKNDYEILFNEIKKQKIKFNISVPQASKSLQTQLDDILTQNQFIYYSKQDPDFSVKLENLLEQSKIELSWRTSFDSDDIKNKLLLKLILTQIKPSTLVISEQNFLNEPFNFSKFLTNNNSINNISLEFWQKSQLSLILNLLATASMRLKYINLTNVKLDEMTVNALINVLRKHPIEILGFVYSHIQTSHSDSIAELGKAIAENQYLISLDMTNLRFNDEIMNKKLLLSQLEKSKSLLDVRIDADRSALKPALERNCRNLLSTISSSYQGIFQQPKISNIEVDQNIKNQTHYSI